MFSYLPVDIQHAFQFIGMSSLAFFSNLWVGRIRALVHSFGFMKISPIFWDALGEESNRDLRSFSGRQVIGRGVWGCQGHLMFF